MRLPASLQMRGSLIRLFGAIGGKGRLFVFQTQTYRYQKPELFSTKTGVPTAFHHYPHNPNIAKIETKRTTSRPVHIRAPNLWRS